MQLLSGSAANQLICLIANCCNIKHLCQTHAFMICRALDHDNQLLSRFIDSCSSLGCSMYAYSIFTFIINRQQQHPDIYLYNTMIRALSFSHAPFMSLFLLKNIQLAGLRPDSYSFPFALKAVVRLLAVPTGMQIHSQTIRMGLHSDVHVLTALIHMYSSCAPVCSSDARKLFDEVSFRIAHVGLWNTMVAACTKLGDLDNAQHLFDCMPQRDIVSWTTLMSGYAHMNQPHQAIAIFQRMQLENVEPDEIALLPALSACAQLGALELGKWIHNYIDRHGVHTTVPLNNALIDMYAKSGNIKRALLVFESMKHKSIITWTTMIAGLALHGLGAEALEMFSRMERERVKPNGITFTAILSACNHVGLVQMGRLLFNNMRSKFGIEPKIKHYGCMIDLLGRAGYLLEAQELLDQMPFEPNAAIWGSLLSASYICGDAVLGESVLQHLIKLEPNNGGNYALLSNLYASLGRWKASRVVRKMMRDKGVKKMPGGSFIEVNNRVTEFIAGETCHPQFDEIYEVIFKINELLRLHELWQEECLRLLEFVEE